MTSPRRRVRRRKNWPPRQDVLIGTGVAFLLLFVLARSLSRQKWATGQVFRHPNDIPLDILRRLDAVLVLGGGVPKSLEEPPVYVQRRCDDAASVVMRHEKTQHLKVTSRLPILTLSAGTAHVPQLLSQDGLPIWESTSSAAYLKKIHGMDSNVYVETTSYDTIGNAFFARTGHTDVNGWRRLLIITNEFHMDRTKAIFDWIFGIGEEYELYYLSSENMGLTEQGLQARRKHEAKGTRTVQQKLAPKYTTLKDTWGFLNQQHDLYTATKLASRARNVGFQGKSLSALKESYGALPQGYM